MSSSHTRLDVSNRKSRRSVWLMYVLVSTTGVMPCAPAHATGRSLSATFMFPMAYTPRYALPSADVKK